MDERCSDEGGVREGGVRDVVKKEEGGRWVDERCGDEGVGGGLVRDVVVDSGCEFGS